MATGSSGGDEADREKIVVQIGVVCCHLHLQIGIVEVVTPQQGRSGKTSRKTVK